MSAAAGTGCYADLEAGLSGDAAAELSDSPRALASSGLETGRLMGEMRIQQEDPSDGKGGELQKREEADQIKSNQIRLSGRDSQGPEAQFRVSG